MNEEEKEPTSDLEWADRPLVRLGLNLLVVSLLLLVGFLVWQRIGVGQATSASFEGQEGNGFGGALNDLSTLNLAPVNTPQLSAFAGVPRQAHLDTLIPTRPRVDVITYTVQAGDNLFDIADKYGLKPETLLWGNYETLKDNPELLSPGQVLNILPTNGAYYQWKQGDDLGAVAALFSIQPQAILDYPGNHIDLTLVNSQTYGLEEGDWLIVPGGSRPLKDWGPPGITRDNPAVARYYGPGSCGSVYTGAIGTGTYVWPTTSHWISGYHYSAIHHAIDIGGAMGNAIFAADSGVVVYAGWSNYGYGNLIVIDHAGGWQTAYAHLSSIAVTCGQSVYQGGFIGAMGSTGNSSGPHLHFEMVYNGSKPNPLDYLP